MKAGLDKRRTGERNAGRRGAAGAKVRSGSKRAVTRLSGSGTEAFPGSGQECPVHTCSGKGLRKIPQELRGLLLQESSRWSEIGAVLYVRKLSLSQRD